MRDFNKNPKFGKMDFNRKLPKRGKKKFDRDDGPRFGSDSRGFRSERGFEKRMHTATCARCKKDCEVPFLPRNNKPVFCSDCFRHKDDFDESQYEVSNSSSSQSSDNGSFKKELAQINEKLDRIIEALELD